MSYNETRELESLPVEIGKLAAEHDALEAKLADPTLYERDRSAFDDATRRIGDVRAALAAAEERWLELEMRREALARE
jgi:ATP-binding cassette subfamily F protein uup